MKHIKHGLFVFAFLVFFSVASTVSAATIPVFDWVAAYTGSLLGVSGGFSQLYSGASNPQDGSFYVTSLFSGTPDFDPSDAGTNSIASVGGQDAFVSKFDVDGNYEWTKTWGGSGTETASRVSVDGNGDIYVTGSFQSTVDFDPGVGTAYATSTGGTDVFLNKLDADGNYEWTKTWGGTGNESGPSSLAVSPTDDVYVLSFFTGTLDFDPGVGTAYATSSGNYDVAVSKFSADGTFQWVKTWGGTNVDIATGLIVGDDESLYVTGYFAGTTDLDPGAGTSAATSAGSYDGFMVKLDSSGTLVWAKTWGGTNYEIPNEIAMDASGNAFSYGYFAGTTDLDPTVETQYATSTGDSDIFVSKFDQNGSFVWGKVWGGTGADGISMLYFSGDQPIAIGSFNGTVDFDPGAGTASKTSAGGSDIFMSLLESDGTFNRVFTIGGTLDEYPDRTVQNISPTGDRFVLIGYYKSAGMDFDPSGDAGSYSAGGTAQFYASFSLVDPAFTRSVTDSTATEGGETAAYTLVLTAPPQEDVTVTITPDSQLTVSTTTLTFASTTWDTPQTITVTATDDIDVEGNHTGTISHEVSSADTAFDGLAISNVSISVTDNDNLGTTSVHRSPKAVIATTLPTPAGEVPPAIKEFLADLPKDKNEAVAAIKTYIATLITQLIAQLQAQIAELQATGN